MKHGIFSGTIKQLKSEVRKSKLVAIRKEADELAWDMRKALDALQSDRRGQVKQLN